PRHGSASKRGVSRSRRHANQKRRKLYRAMPAASWLGNLYHPAFASEADTLAARSRGGTYCVSRGDEHVERYTDDCSGCPVRRKGSNRRLLHIKAVRLTKPTSRACLRSSLIT